MNELVKKYFAINNNIQLKSDFEELYFSHPNYPSLFSITDSLEALGIENVAIKFPKEKISELPDIFLANFDGHFVLVHKNNTEVRIENENGENSKLSISSFVDGWNGIILIIEPKIFIGNDVRKSKSNFSSFLVLFFFVAASFLYFGVSSVQIFCVLISLAGVLISILILKEKFGISSDIVSKICTGQETSCNSVIKSGNRKIIKNVTFSDIPIIFFGSSLFSLLLDPANAVAIIALLSFFSIPIILYSIWLQKAVLKKWCPLCLIVSLLVIIQSLPLFYFQSISMPEILGNGYYSYLSFGAVFILWVFINPLIEGKTKSFEKVNELLRFKRDINIFKFLAREVSSLEGIEYLTGINIGSNDCNLNVKLFLSPSCGYCHSSYSDACSLVKKYPDKVNLSVFFNINPENLSNPYLKVVQSLVAIQSESGSKAFEAINDWHIEKMQLDDWLKKWNRNEISENVNDEIQKQYDWCFKNGFNYTPVKLVNTFILPKQYEINELSYFVNEFGDIEKELDSMAVSS
ncbi:vitamin K epoxide reductase family protein [Flavobacterium qiangtangense]|uniref:Vitamin K epoxide reductase family protein n=1 Tax=Flavobacterium qiangtangense TaxID=1442595 RepID=A0ABW1PNR9_9FLAO